MLKAFLNWLTGKPNSQPTQPEVAPYKVETPVVSEPQPIKCGCGRSLSGYCIGLHKLSQVEWDAHEDNPNRPTVAPEPIGVILKCATVDRPETFSCCVCKVPKTVAPYPVVSNSFTLSK